VVEGRGRDCGRAASGKNFAKGGAESSLGKSMANTYE